MNRKRYERIKEGVKVSYDRAAGEYHALFGSELAGHEYDRALLDSFAAQLPAGALICDMGCGPSAHIGGYLFGNGYRVEGLDISPVCVDHAKKINPRMVFHRTDMTATGLPDCSFDGILSFYSLFHIPRRYRGEALAEFSRLLRPGGRLLLVNHKGRFRKTIRRIWNHDGMELFCDFSTEREIRSLLEGNGFRVEAMESRASYYGFPRERIIAKAVKIGPGAV